MKRRNFVKSVIGGAFLTIIPTTLFGLFKEKPKLIIDSYGNKFWSLNNKLHRINGPACEYVNGDKCWYLNGKYHRINGPAVECTNGDKEWYLDGKRHRIDGPATEWSNGDKAWCLNGKKVTEKKVINYNITKRNRSN